MNIGNMDRIVRLISGVSLLTFDYLASSNWEIVFLGIGLWSLMSSVFGFCPFYNIMGINTCPHKLPIE